MKPRHSRPITDQVVSQLNCDYLLACWGVSPLLIGGLHPRDRRPKF
jgi:hypothetical protein